MLLPYFIVIFNFNMRNKSIIIIVIIILLIAILWVVNTKKIHDSQEVYKNKENIRIGGSQCFTLGKNEYTIDLKSKDTAIINQISRYYWYLYNRETDQVLNQVVKGENNFYIWLSFMVPNEFIRKQNVDTSLTIIKSKNYICDNKKFSSFLLKRKNMFIKRTIFMAPAGNLIIIDNPDFDSVKIVKLFNDTTLIPQRLKCK